MKKVHLVKESTLKDFVRESVVLRSTARHWLTKLRQARWAEPGDIKRDFGTADLLGNGSMRVVFDLGGNKFRMICRYYFGTNMVKLYICWIGSHNDYDDVCRKGLQFTVFNY